MASLSDRASGTFSSLRTRFGGGSRRERYDDYGEYGYDGYDDYDEYGYDDSASNPYDDIDDVSGVGEVRTRAASSSSRYHPPLLSFDEAKVNTYVPDRLLRDPLERLSSQRGYERPGADYKPRVRDSVDMGRSAEYDLGVSGQAAMLLPDEPASAAPAASVPATPAPAASAGAGYDPYASYQAGGTSAYAPTRKVKAIAPVAYSEVESIARACKTGDVAVLVLTRTPGDLAKRILDFSFGVASALDANVDCIADKVFVIARGQELTESERAQLRAQGVIL